MNHADLSQSRRKLNAEGGDREHIIQEFTHVIRAMAHRLAFRLPAYLDAEDLVSVGIIGLMDAMEKYDPTREAKFKTYAEFRIRGAIVVSLDDLGVQDQDGHKILGMLSDASQPDPLASLVNGRERQVLCRAIQELAEKERLVLTLYYFEELTMKEIGQILKVTESRVCQIHSKAIVHLKARLQPVEA